MEAPLVDLGSIFQNEDYSRNDFDDGDTMTWFDQVPPMFDKD